MRGNFVAAILVTVPLLAQGPMETNAADAIISRYCQGCHNDKLKTASFSLSAARAADIGTSPAVWEKVLRKVRTGEMPPPLLPKPDEAARAQFVNFVETQLDRAAAAKPDPGAPSIHRLNRAEYANAVRDLLQLEVDQSSGLPADNASYGFDNIGDVLTVSPLHMEKYMSIARHVSQLAVGTARLKPSVEKIEAPRGSAVSDDLPFGERNGILLRRNFPADAQYSILVRVRGIPTANAPAPKLDLRLDGARLKLFDVAIDVAEAAQATRNFEIRLPVKGGMHSIAAGFLGESWKVEGGAPPVRTAAQAAAQPPTSPLSVDYLLIGGPFDAAGPGDTPSRKRIFSCRPAGGEPEAPCAKQILTSLARQAYRRPVDAADLDPLMKLFATGRSDEGSFDGGIAMGLRGILVSPNFLFRAERPPRGAAPASAYRVSDLHLASRLSFFLWSSIPDEELLQLASQGKLRNPATLERQVRRMLSDPKAKALVDNFAGQWLQLRNVASWRPDPVKYKAFDEPLRAALTRETELFFANIVNEDRSVLDFLNADYTFLNERLAKHYGIADVRGSYFRRVALNNPERGGILTQGSVLTVTSYPTRTSPVLRGKWILENVLGAPPPPPPPDVPALAETAGSSPRNLRELLEKHRANAACASCHARLDPLGFALENYDAIGSFRAKEGGAEIDASGSMPGGIMVRGAGDLKKILMERRDEFVECLSEKLLIYALGRGLEPADWPAVREIRRKTAAADYKFSALAMAVVDSVPFEMRRAPGP